MREEFLSFFDCTKKKAECTQSQYIWVAQRSFRDGGGGLLFKSSSNSTDIAIQYSGLCYVFNSGACHFLFFIPTIVLNKEVV